MSDRIAFAGKVEANGRRIRGEVVLAGSRTFRNGEWLEVDPAAVVRANAKNVFASWEHDDTKILGAAKNGTLTVTRTEHGFTYETAELPQTSYANDALELLHGGYVTGTSFEIDGMRSKFYADPDTGERVRRIYHIDTFRQVGPVRDPAFANSSAAAFSKENDDMAEPTVEPTAPVAPAPTPTPEPTPAVEPVKQEFSEVYEAALRFAKTRTLAEIEQAMDNLANGNMTEADDQAYSAMAKVYDERKRAEEAAAERFAARKLARDMVAGRMPAAPAQVELFASDDYSQAYGRLLRGDPRGMEQFAQAIAGDGTQGGYTVPDGMLNRIVEAMVAFGGIANVAEVITTADGQSLRWPTNDDTGNAADLVAEGSATAAGADLVFGEVTLGAYSYDASGASNLPLKISKELIQDAAFDIEGYVARKLGERLARKMAAAYATGTGSSQPKGLFALSADTMTATTMLAALVEHMFQIDQAYREGGNCRWVFSDTTLAKVYGSVDLNNRPLFIPSADSSGAGRPAGTLLGYPVTLDQGAGTKVAFGDIREGFVIRRVKGITVDVDPYSYISTRQIGFHAWARTDSTIQDTNAYSVSEYSGVSADTTA